MTQPPANPKNVARASRWPPLSASVLPYGFGALMLGAPFRPLHFFLGLVAVVATHRVAHFLSGHAASNNGGDTGFRCFFGGFREGGFSARSGAAGAMVLGAAGLGAVVALAALWGRVTPLVFYVAAIFLGWAYSARPLQLARRRLGELVIFVLFGPGCVVGGYLFQTGAFPPLAGWVLSLPFGFLAASILLANEVADAREDAAAGRQTLVVAAGAENGYLLYAAAVGCALASVVLCLVAGYVGLLSLACAAAVDPAAAATFVLRNRFGEKPALARSARLAVLAQAVVGLVLLADLLLLGR